MNKEEFISKDDHISKRIRLINKPQNKENILIKKWINTLRKEKIKQNKSKTKQWKCIWSKTPELNAYIYKIPEKLHKN